jgi:flavorubredoxin
MCRTKEDTTRAAGVPGFERSYAEGNDLHSQFYTDFMNIVGSSPKGDWVMSKVLVVYCSMSGNTKAAAEAIAEGARTAGARVTLKKGADAQPKDLLECDAVALGSYDAFSYMGGGLKDFLDRAFYPTQGQVTDKPYVAFLTHGGGGKAIESIESIAQSFKFKKAVKPVLVKGKPEGQAIVDLKALGAKLAAAAGK